MEWVWIIFLQWLRSQEKISELVGLNTRDWCLMVAVGSLSSDCSLTIDHIHWSPSFMKIVGWLWIIHDLLSSTITPYPCAQWKGITLSPNSPFSSILLFHFFLPVFPFKGNLLLFRPFVFILFFHLDNNENRKMSLSQTYFSNFTIIWNLWYPSPSPSSYQGCYGPTETFLLPPV